MVKVLILDDEQAMHTIMKQMLARIEGVELIGCFLKPANAIDFVRKEAADLAFIDIKIGRENGLQVARELRAIASDLDIVFVTSHKEYALESFDAYPLDYIVKPVSRSRLEQTIARAVERKVQSGEEDESVPRLQVKVLGRFELHDMQGRTVRWMSRKSAELCAYLLFNRGQFVAKARIIEEVFPDMPIKNAETYLNTTVYQLRKALTPLGMKAIVQSFNEQYRLEMKDVEADFVQFEKKVKQWSETNDSFLEEGIALEQQYGGCLFESNTYHWCIAEQYRLEQIYFSFAKRLACQLTKHQQYGTAIVVLRRILAIAELDEDANLLLLQAYREQKEWPAIKKHLRQYAELYEQELGLPLPFDIKQWQTDS